MSIKESLPLKMHIYYLYIYIVLKVKSFLANMCSIPSRKCNSNMSLHQIPSMMHQCLRRRWYFFSKVYHQFVQHVFQKGRQQFCNKSVFESATLLSSGPSTCAKTFVNTADHSFEKCMYLSKKFMQNTVDCGPMKTTGVFIWQESITLPYLSGLTCINPTPKKRIWQLVQRPE